MHSQKDRYTMDVAPTDTDNRLDFGAMRSRTVTWHHPDLTFIAKALSMGGLDCMQAIVDGVLPKPPMEGVLGFDFVEVERGRVVVTCVPDESAYNGLGLIHGGLICTLLDTVTGCALHSTLPPGKGYTSIAINVNYLKPVRADGGMLTVTGTVVKTGSRVGFTEGVVMDSGGKPVATASSTQLVLDL
jgi:uncharacterized protein (TIGR00369 family)